MLAFTRPILTTYLLWEIRLQMDCQLHNTHVLSFISYSIHLYTEITACNSMVSLQTITYPDVVLEHCVGGTLTMIIMCNIHGRWLHRSCYHISVPVRLVELKCGIIRAIREETESLSRSIQSITALIGDENGVKVLHGHVRFDHVTLPCGTDLLSCLT